MATASESNPPKPDRNALGKAAFIIGLIALVLSFVPIIGFVSWLLAPLAIIFGLIALRRPSKSLAIAGIITGAIALFICVQWVRGTQAVGEAMSADTFNNDGRTTDNSKAPLVNATVKGVWSDLEDNKISAGKKYGGHRLAFTGERIQDIGGTEASPTLSFIGKSEDYLEHSITATFAAADGAKIGALKKGGKVAFVCQNVGEGFGGSYSLSSCSLK